MSDAYDTALELAGELLGRPLELPLGRGEPESGREFRRLATLHTFGDSWVRTQQLGHEANRGVTRRRRSHTRRRSPPGVPGGPSGP
jgi:hypothetical protein